MKIAIIGAFGKKLNLLNGQTIKTKIIADELERMYGEHDVLRIDTYGKLNWILSVIKSIWAFLFCRNLIIMPANNGLKVFAPLLAYLNQLFRKRIHYVVIGGWLDCFLNKNKLVDKTLRSFHGIYVETQTMKNSLVKRGFTNVKVLPNCKKLKILKKEELVYSNSEPFRLVIFSRIIKEKGIEDAIIAVNKANSNIGKKVFKLTIYGQIDNNQIDWFKALTEKYDLNNHDNTFYYGGSIPFEKSVEILKDYFALLFPTYYEGEGFAGTLIDAYSAGVPVIASNWKYNSEIVKPGYTGKIFQVHDIDYMTNILVWAYNNQSEWNNMKVHCLDEVKKYQLETVLGILTNNLI